MARSQGQTARRAAKADGPDPFGYDPAFAARLRPLTQFFYRRYWRVCTDGLEHVPSAGAALLVSNHSGGIPLDAAMIGAAIDLDHPQRRVVRFLYDRFVAGMPLLGTLYNRMGSVVASFHNARRLLAISGGSARFPRGGSR